MTGSSSDDHLQLTTPLSPPFAFAGGNGHDTIEVMGSGSYDFTSDLSPSLSNVALTIDTGASATFHSVQHLESLTINGLADAAAGGTNTIVTQAISVGGKLDLRDNDLIVNYSTVSPIGTLSGSTYGGVLGLVQTGHGNPNAGIVTSSLAGNLYSLGVAEAKDALGPTGGTFDGQSVDSSAVLVKYTYSGDATLDGKINVDDYIRIDAGIAQTANSWFWGDFNYDGKINIDDYTLIDNGIQSQGPPL